MRAITVKQPWAWTIIGGGKNVENRTRIGTWRPALGERIALHAGLTWSVSGGQDGRIREAYAEKLAELQSVDIDRALAEVERNGVHPMHFQRRGVLLGTIEVVDVHRQHTACLHGTCSVWGDIGSGIVHLVLANPRPCAPHPARGQLGLWTLPPAIAEQLS